jgi:CTP:molybdopterin cytidylyltransferase MocA
VVHNPRPDDGRVSSQRLGLAALNPNLDAVLVALADQPLINEQDITSLIGAFKKRPADTAVVVPRVAGQPGNPVMFGGAVRQQILAGEGNIGCRQWRAAHPQAVHHFDTDSQRFILDIDTLEDLERFERNTGHALRWPARVASAPA